MRFPREIKKNKTIFCDKKNIDYCYLNFSINLIKLTNCKQINRPTCFERNNIQPLITTFLVFFLEVN